VNWMPILVTAFLSSLFTVIAASLWFRFRTRPSLMRQLDEEFRDRLAEASDVIGERVEQSVRQGVVEGVSALASREVLEGTTRTLAKTSAEMVEERVNRLFRRRSGRWRERDDDR
jgi:hypothetical protein